MYSVYAMLVVELGLVAAVAFGLWFGLSVLRRRSGHPSGGWAALEAAWGVATPPPEPITTRANLAVGRVVWRNCVVVGCAPSGLHLAVRIPLLGGLGRRPVRIPWNAFRDPEPVKLFWQDARLWHLGEPEVATLTLPAELETHLHAKGYVLGRALRHEPN